MRPKQCDVGCFWLTEDLMCHVIKCETAKPGSHHQVPSEIYCKWQIKNYAQVPDCPDLQDVEMLGWLGLLGALHTQG